AGSGLENTVSAVRKRRGFQILRWHRELLNQRHAATCAPRRRGRQRTVRSIRALVLRLARENRSWGYRRIHGELTALGIKIAASTVWEILKEHGVEPAPGRAQTTWATFLRSQAEALLACDFFETRTLSGARLHVFAVIEHATRRIRILGATAHPTAAWATQLARNLAMDLEDTGSKAKFMIRDRDCKFTAAFDTVLHDAGLRVVLTGIRTPRMKPRVAYCTSSGRCAVFWCRPGQTVAVGSDILLAVSGVSGVVRRRWVSLRPCARAGGLGPGGG